MKFVPGKLYENSMTLVPEGMSDMIPGGTVMMFLSGTHEIKEVSFATDIRQKDPTVATYFTTLWLVGDKIEEIIFQPNSRGLRSFTKLSS